MASTTHHKLNTGASIPAIGFGTWQDKDAQEDAVYTALKAGYRHIDTVSLWRCITLRDATYSAHRRTFTALSQQSVRVSRSRAFREIRSSS